MKNLLRMGETSNVVEVKEDTPEGDQPRLYVKATMADQLGARLNPAQVRMLHDTLGQWLSETGETRREVVEHGSESDRILLAVREWSDSEFEAVFGFPRSDEER